MRDPVLFDRFQAQAKPIQFDHQGETNIQVMGWSFSDNDLLDFLPE